MSDGPLGKAPEDGDEWNTSIQVRGLGKAGIEIHDCNRGKIDTSFVELLTVVLDGKGAGEERRAIQERTMRGKVNRVNPGASLPPALHTVKSLTSIKGFGALRSWSKQPKS